MYLYIVELNFTIFVINNIMIITFVFIFAIFWYNRRCRAVVLWLASTWRDWVQIHENVLLFAQETEVLAGTNSWMGWMPCGPPNWHENTFASQPRMTSRQIFSSFDLNCFDNLKCGGGRWPEGEIQNSASAHLQHIRKMKAKIHIKLWRHRFFYILLLFIIV